MFRVTNRSTVFQMVWLQDVVKVTLQTFGPAVGLLKKKKIQRFLVMWQHFLVLMFHIYLAWALGKSLCFLAVRNFIGNLSCKFKISPNNYKLSIVLWRKTDLKVGNSEARKMNKSTTQAPDVLKGPVLNTTEPWEQAIGGSPVQRSGDKSYLAQ